MCIQNCFLFLVLGVTSNNKFQILVYPHKSPEKRFCVGRAVHGDLCAAVGSRLCSVGASLAMGWLGRRGASKGKVC